MADFLNLNLDETPEIHLLSDGEHELRILSVDLKDFQSDEYGPSQALNIRTESIDDEFADDVYHTIWLPRKSDTPKQRAKTNKRIIDFCMACDVEPTNSLEITQFVGQVIKANVGTRTRKDTGEPQNYIKALV